MSKNQNSFNPTEDSNKVNFGLFIKKHREKKGYTQQALADMIGLTPKSISFIERGINYPSQDNIFRLAELLDLSLDEFVFSYSRFNKNICIDELNEMIKQLDPDEQGMLIGMIKAACETMLTRKSLK